MGFKYTPRLVKCKFDGCVLFSNCLGDQAKQATQQSEAAEKQELTSVRSLVSLLQKHAFYHVSKAS